VRPSRREENEAIKKAYADWRKKMQDMYEQTHNKMNKEQDDYDECTKHGEK
jgi:hypothetical protein